MSEATPVVYVIDDNPALREALDGLIRSVHLSVRTFASTEEFLQFKRPDAPGCLVLDVRLPGLSGLDFQREMAKLDIDLPVIIITGHGDVPMSVRALKAGAIEFLPKPFRDQDLLDAIYVGIERDRARRAALGGDRGAARAFRQANVARAADHVEGRQRPAEQADRCRAQAQRGHRQGASPSRHAQNEGAVAG